MASVFDQNVLTPTAVDSPDTESRVMLLKTANAVGEIASPAFLQYANVQGNHLLSPADVLQPGAEQILILSGDEAEYTFGNLSLFLRGNTDLSAAGNQTTAPTQPDAYQLTVGQNRQTLIQGVDMATKANQTGFKQEYWDTETSTNMDQVKVSYFVVTSTVQNYEGMRFTFGLETLIQWGNRTLTRWSTESRTTVGHAVGTIVGNTTATNHGSLHENNYAGVSVEAVNGGTDFHFALGFKSLYQEGFMWTTNVGASMTLHGENFIVQGIGIGAGLMNSKTVQSQLDNAIASVKAHGVRIGSGVANILTGALTGTPRV